MCRLVLIVSLAIASVVGVIPPPAKGQNSEIISEHIRMAIPVERQWLGRDIISDLERFWKFVNGAAPDGMPRRIALSVRWDLASSSTAADGRITLGMDGQATGPDLKAFVFRQAAREMARIGLMRMARQTEPVEHIEFLMEGMSEILVHEFDRSTRVLGAAWIIANLLDRAGQLGFTQQSEWARYAQGRHNLRSAAPGVTFLTMCRDTYGREKTMKLFEALRGGSLPESLASTFKSSAAALESAWLKRVREQPAWEDVTVSSEEDGPILEQTSLAPGVVRPGQTAVLHLFLRDRANDLPNESVFVLDRNSGKVYVGKAGQDGSTQVEIQVEPGRPAGTYGYRATAIDDSGNVRNWTGEYAVSVSESGPGTGR